MQSIIRFQESSDTHLTETETFCHIPPIIFEKHSGEKTEMCQQRNSVGARVARACVEGGAESAEGRRDIWKVPGIKLKKKKSRRKYEDLKVSIGIWTKTS